MRFKMKFKMMEVYTVRFPFHKRVLAISYLKAARNKKTKRKKKNRKKGY